MIIDNDHTADEKLPNNHLLYKDRILAEQVKQIYTLAPIGFVATVLNSLLVFFVMRVSTSPDLLLTWLTAVLGITLLRMGLVAWFRSVEFGAAAAGRWAKRFIASLFVAGLAWGSIGFLPFTGIALPQHVFIAFVLGGMAAGASSTFSMLRLGYPAFAIPALVPLTIHFFLMHEQFHLAMGLMVSLFCILLWKIAEHNYSVNRTSLVLRFQNTGMIVGLKRLNARLSAEIAAKHQAEADLRAHHQQLERLVQERTADLTAVNREMELFAYMASHDLQEPLRMVVGFLELLKKKYGGQLDEKADMYIGYAVDGGKRMQKLIEGLLAYSRISGGTGFAPVDVNTAYAAALANLASVISESGAEVTKNDLPTVIGDEVLLQQLLQNLISNALKYRKPDTPPRVQVAAERAGDEWVISVKDNGIGIAQDNFGKIFQIFQRLHTCDEYPGTGIGLASCKKIVERHGGVIWVDSKPGEGSVFSFKLPASGCGVLGRKGDA